MDTDGAIHPKSHYEFELSDGTHRYQSFIYYATSLSTTTTWSARSSAPIVKLRRSTRRRDAPPPRSPSWPTATVGVCAPCARRWRYPCGDGRRGGESSKRSQDGSASPHPPRDPRARANRAKGTKERRSTVEREQRGLRERETTPRRTHVRRGRSRANENSCRLTPTTVFPMKPFCGAPPFAMLVAQTPM